MEALQKLVASNRLKFEVINRTESYEVIAKGACSSVVSYREIVPIYALGAYPCPSFYAAAKRGTNIELDYEAEVDNKHSKDLLVDFFIKLEEEDGSLYTVMIIKDVPLFKEGGLNKTPYVRINDNF